MTHEMQFSIGLRILTQDDSTNLFVTSCYNTHKVKTLAADNGRCLGSGFAMLPEI